MKKCDMVKLIADAPSIINRLKESGVTVIDLMREKSCSYNKLMDAILTVIDIKAWKEICKLQSQRGGAKRKIIWERKRGLTLEKEQQLHVARVRYLSYLKSIGY